MDALNVYDVLSSLETLSERNRSKMVGNTGLKEDGEKAADTGEQVVDSRSIANLMLDQVEFANVLVLSKAHMIPGSAEKREKAIHEMKGLLKRLNPKATVVVPEQPHFADLKLSDICYTGLFDLEEASASAGWKQEMNKE